MKGVKDGLEPLEEEKRFTMFFCALDTKKAEEILVK